MEELSKEKKKELMIEFAERYPLGCVATSSGLNYPSIAWVFILAHRDFSFYFTTRTVTQKFKDIEENAYVALALTNPITLETLQVRGKAELILDPDEVRNSLESLRETFAKEKKKWMAPADQASRGIYNVDVSRWIPPVSQIREGSYAFFKVVPEWARFRRYDADWKEGKDFTEYLIEE